MMEISPTDWQTLSSLAEEAKLPPERVLALRHRIDSGTSGFGRPYLLIAGLHRAGIEHLLEDWIGEQVVEALDAAGDRPLVIGPAPEKVQPAVGAWPVLKRSSAGGEAGHLVVVRAVGVRLAADVAVGLGALGFFDEMILVSRLGQPVTQAEREFARLFAPLAATARALIVGLPGEKPSSSEISKVARYASNHLCQAGFGEIRCLGSGVWFAEGGRDNLTGTVEDVAEWLEVSPREVESGIDGMFCQALRTLLTDISSRVSTTLAPAQTPIDEEECERLASELDQHLAAVGREATKWVEKRPIARLSDQELENYCLEKLKGWGAYCGAEGVWLRYVERLRPGTQAALLAEAVAAIKTLNLNIPEGATAETVSSQSASAAEPEDNQPSWLKRTVIEAKRLAAAAIGGLIGYLLVGMLPDAGRFSVDPLLLTGLRYVALLVAGVLTYQAARRVFPDARPVPRTEKAPLRLPAPSFSGWDQVERHLSSWFRSQMQMQPLSASETLRSLEQRLGLADEDSQRTR